MIVERLVLPAMMQTLLHAIRKGLVSEGEDGTCLEPIADLLLEALKEPLADAPPDRHGKLIRRSMRVTTAAMESISDQLFSVQWCAIALLIADFTQRDIISVSENSAFAKAWDAMIAMGFDELPPGGDETAEMLAVRLARVLSEGGLFVRTVCPD